MKTQQVSADAFKPGKGLHAPLSEELVRFLATAAADVQNAWDEAEDEKEFWEILTDKWGNEASAERYGDKTWIGVPVGTQELRVGITRNTQGVLALDLRLWWL